MYCWVNAEDGDGEKCESPSYTDQARPPSPPHGKSPSPTYASWLEEHPEHKSPVYADWQKEHPEHKSPSFADWLAEEEERKKKQPVIPVFGSFAVVADDAHQPKPKRPRARRPASPLGVYAGLLILDSAALRQMFVSVVRELGRGTYGVVHEVMLSYRSEVVAVKITEQKTGLPEAAANDRMLKLRRHTENFAIMHDTFLSTAHIQGTAIISRGASVEPHVWIVQEKVDVDWAAWMSQNFDMDDERGKFFKTPFPESMFFELAWLLFVCTKHTKSMFGDMRIRNSCMKKVPYARAYHVNGNVYVFGPEAPMFKMIDMSFVPNPNPGHIPGIARDVDLYLALMSDKERRIMADLRGALATDEAFDALVSRAGYARLSERDVDALLARGVEVRHFYA